MGADLILARCHEPRTFAGTPPEWGAIKDEVTKRCRDALPDAAQAQWSPILEDLDDDAVVETLVGWAREVIQGIQESWRDITIEYEVGASHGWVVTGGMSWGDDPSESYQAVDAMGELGIFSEPFGERVGFNRCEENESGKHGPLAAAYDPEDAEGYVSVRCVACGISTGIPIPDADELNWE